MAELWVKGLRKLCGQTDEKSDKLAKQAFESGNLPGHRSGHGMGVSESKRAEREHKKRTKSLMLLQQDLFVMTTTTVFRNLEEERIWDIDQSVRERFNAKSLYELALREDIPWRQWNHWVREKIVTYLRDNNRLAPTQNQYGQQQMYGNQQQMYQQQMYQQQQMQQQNMYGQPPMHQQQMYGQPMQQQQMRASGFNVVPPNVTMPQQQTDWPNQPPPQAGAPPSQGGGQVGPDGKQTDENCSLM